MTLPPELKPREEDTTFDARSPVAEPTPTPDVDRVGVKQRGILGDVTYVASVFLSAVTGRREISSMKERLGFERAARERRLSELAKAAAADTEYVPRPEWYFLWLFQFGKYVHGFQWVESALLPAIGIGTLLLLPEFQTTRKLRARGVVAMVAFMFGLAALAHYEDRDLPEKPQYEKGLVVKAARDYKVECASCHGATGKGDGPDSARLETKAKDFTRADFWDEGTMTDMIEVISKGEAPDMPAFGERMSAEEILAIAKHIEANFRPR